MSKPKRHHYVPRWYLEGFTDDTGFVHVYDRGRKLWRRERPHQVMIINNYYRQEWAPAGVDVNVLEKMFGTLVEPKGCESFNKLLKRGHLDTNDFAAMLTYLEFQRIRVPRQAKMAFAIAKNALNQHLPDEVARAVLRGEVRITIKDSVRFEMMRIVAGKITPWLIRMNWLIHEAAPGSSFITNDSPVCFYHGHFPPPTEPGIALAGTMIVFPLDSRRLLLMAHPEAGKEGINPSTPLPSSAPAGEGPSIVDGGPLASEQVQHYNNVVLRLSDHLIVGNSKEVLEHCLGETIKGH